EVMTFERVDETARLALGRHQVIPAPGRQLRRRGEIGQPGCDGVGPVKIVEQPPVQSVFPQRLLNRRYRQWHLLSIQGAVSGSGDSALYTEQKIGRAHV